MPGSSESSLEQRLLNAIVEKARDTIAITDSRGVLLQFSPKLAAISGGDPSDYVVRNVHELERDGIFQPSVSALVLRKRRGFQVMQRTPAGRTVLAEGYPVLAESGEIERVVSVSYDLTDLERLRAEYQHLQSDLMESTVGEPKNLPVESRRIHFESPAARAIYRLIRRVAKTDANVLILGETGVGKTLFAHELHDLSDRCEGPLVELNCAALPEDLFEAELFGHESGAFTDARRGGKAGLIEEAGGGTLMLDEVGELPLSIQPKLLKVLQDRRVRRVGGTRDRVVDFRLVAATNSDLKSAVEDGRFRRDLYYRLNVVPIHIPPLRRRRDDLAMLIDHFWGTLSRRHGVHQTLRSEVRTRLLTQDWPGNVRELENALERLILTGDESVFTGTAVDAVSPQASRSAVIDPDTPQFDPQLKLPAAVARLERKMLEDAKRSASSTYGISRLLGISQPTVVRKLKKHGL